MTILILGGLALIVYFAIRISIKSSKKEKSTYAPPPPRAAQPTSHSPAAPRSATPAKAVPIHQSSPLKTDVGDASSFISPYLFPASISAELRKRCAERTRSELNFIYDHQGDIICYTPGAQALSGLLFVVDERFNPRIVYQTLAPINACNISDNGKYAICQTEKIPGDNIDSGVYIILDLQKRIVVKRVPVVLGRRNILTLHIDEDSESFFVEYQGEDEIEFDFTGKSTDDNAVWRGRLTGTSGYERLEAINEMIDTLSESYDPAKDEMLLPSISGLRDNVSPYQQSLMYKSLGECYMKNGFTDKAISAFTNGLRLNPNLAVKRSLSQLKKKKEDEK